MTLRLTTPAFTAGGGIPARFTCDGSDISPEVGWSDPPAGTESFALVVEDPDAPGRTWVHWIVYDLPPTARALPEGVAAGRRLPPGARQGRNDFRRTGYGDPCPPPGSDHRYQFQLYALDTKLGLRSGATRADLERSMRGHVLARAELLGRYKRAELAPR